MISRTATASTTPKLAYKRYGFALAAALLITGCGSDTKNSSTGTSSPTAPAPKITTDTNGQAKVTVPDQKTADTQCEALQAAKPKNAKDHTVYLVSPTGENFVSCLIP